MLFFVDTANIADIKEAHELGILAGVTTNPSLVAKERTYRSTTAFVKSLTWYQVQLVRKSFLSKQKK